MTYFYDWKKPSSSRFSAVSENERGHQMYPSAHVDLEHEQEEPNFGRRSSGLGEYVDLGGARTGQLFTNRPGKITGAFADPTMRAHMPTLLGLAADRNMRMTGGRMPMPDSSLSPQSAPMVQKLRDKGINFPTNPHNPDAKATNTISNQPMFATPWDPAISEGRVMKPGEVNSGRSLVRSMMLRRSVNPNQFKEDEALGVSTVMSPRPGPGQGNFPGMEPKKK